MPDTPALQNVRVLVAHRDAGFCAGVAELLEGVGAEVAVASARVAAAEEVRRGRPSVVLLEHGLDGPVDSLIRDVAGDPELLGTSVISVHPGPRVADVVEALRLGATDVWSGGPSAPELIARVRAAHRQSQLLDLAMRRYSDLEDLAYRDELTELPNRRGATRQIEVLLSRSRRHGHQLAVLLIDADHFKLVNDHYGHAVGDLVLRELAQRLRDRVRREDVVGRWGGEELIVALPETAPDAALAVAESVRAAIAGRPVEADGVAVQVTVSIGVAAWVGDRLDELLARADRALYDAKAAGRDRVVADAAAEAARRMAG